MLRLNKTTREDLEEGRVVTALVWPSTARFRAAATLEWSFESGAIVRLVEPTDEWDLPFNSGHFVAHLAVNGGEELTMLDARVTGLSADDRITRLGAFTLALGAHTDDLERWPAARYSTANLTEWFGESGINVSYPDTEDVFIRLEYQTPARCEVAVAAGDLAFGSEHDTPGVIYAADWSISTRRVVGVVPNKPSTLDDLSREFSQPLRALTTFVSDRPDSLTTEQLINTGAQREALIWRVAPQTHVRPWRAASDYLFRVPQADDFEGIIRKWWALYEEVHPALGHFAQHVNDGATYSPERLIMLVAALEAYGDAHHKTTELKTLRTRAGVDSSVTGCTNSALDLLGYCRGYFAHLSSPSPRYTPRDADDGTFPSIRRASALMQACLLRDLDFDSTHAEELLREHYRAWPLP